MPELSTIREVREYFAPLVEQQGLNAVAEKAVVDRGNLSKWLNGADSALSIASLAKVATALGLSWRAVYRVSRRRSK